MIPMFFAAASSVFLIASLASAQESDQHVFAPEQESEFQEYLFNLQQFGIEASGQFQFDQTRWSECDDQVTGNYVGYRCANRRQISVILKDYLEIHFQQCVDAGLSAQGEGYAAQLHLVHAGILGDPRHSPRSLHSESRAIDIKSVNVRLTNGSVRAFTYQDRANRSFYSALRECWGKILNRFNGCPLYDGRADRTGSIGWEDRNHRNHLHLSVPYCVNGRYGSGYFRK